MEAIALALTGRINGKGANDELNPYWFNTELVADFVERRQEVKILVYLRLKLSSFLIIRQNYKIYVELLIATIQQMHALVYYSMYCPIVNIMRR
jgi:hypothetical protein